MEFGFCGEAGVISAFAKTPTRVNALYAFRVNFSLQSKADLQKKTRPAITLNGSEGLKSDKT